MAQKREGKQKLVNKQFNFRLSKLVSGQISKLAEKWGESRSQAIRRCIDRVYQQEFVESVTE